MSNKRVIATRKFLRESTMALSGNCGRESTVFSLATTSGAWVKGVDAGQRSCVEPRKCAVEWRQSLETTCWASVFSIVCLVSTGKSAYTVTLRTTLPFLTCSMTLVLIVT